MDLKDVWDHPANLLITRAGEYTSKGDYASAWGLRRAADFLREYEVNQSVTFASLDNAALLRVRRSQEEFDQHILGTEEHSEAGNDLADALDHLLGAPTNG